MTEEKGASLIADLISEYNLEVGKIIGQNYNKFQKSLAKILQNLSEKYSVTLK